LKKVEKAAKKVLEVARKELKCKGKVIEECKIEKDHEILLPVLGGCIKAASVISLRQIAT